MVCFKVKGEGEILVLERPAVCSTGTRGEVGRGQARLRSCHHGGDGRENQRNSTYSGENLVMI